MPARETADAARPTDVEHRLVAELDDATAHVERLEDEYRGLLADPAVIQEDRDTTRTLLERARTTATAARRALERHREGTYGRCTRCGRDIPPERLEAVPGAHTCVACS